MVPLCMPRFTNTNVLGALSQINRIPGSVVVGQLQTRTSSVRRCTHHCRKFTFQIFCPSGDDVFVVYDLILFCMFFFTSSSSSPRTTSHRGLECRAKSIGLMLCFVSPNPFLASGDFLIASHMQRREAIYY